MTIAAPYSTSFDAAAFLRAAAHEIANPLNAISMNAELTKILLQRDQTPRATEVLERLLVDSGRCARILRGMQRFASSLNTQSRETIQIHALIDLAITEFKQEATISLPAVQIDAGDQSIRLARLPMVRALVGLLLNAAEAGATAVAIHVGLLHDWIQIEISDNGRGISPETSLRAIEPFFTTQRAEGHNGLGLTLADTLVRAHGGNLRIEEITSGGTRIVLQLPTTHEN